ncbi:MAG: hypothetical protein D6798_14840 [Deltaproteobacteria bacterium]|nr:MAG: hypothetical protein D6798_14840 [Deltaproteobacteria bacterium]
MLRTALTGGVIVLVLVLADRLGIREMLDPEKLAAAGAAPTVGLVAAYGALWLTMMGGSMTAIAAGAVLFGWAGGTIASVVGALVAHSAWFWLSRHNLRPVVQRRAGARVRWLIGLIERGGSGLVVAWNLLGAPGPPFLFAAALSRLPYRTFALGVLCMAPRALLTALVVDTALRWSPGDIPADRWTLLLGIGLPLVASYAGLLILRPELRPWRFGDPVEAPEPEASPGVARPSSPAPSPPPSAPPPAGSR